LQDYIFPLFLLEMLMILKPILFKRLEP